MLGGDRLFVDGQCVSQCFPRPVLGGDRSFIVYVLGGDRSFVDDMCHSVFLVLCMEKTGRSQCLCWEQTGRL